MIETNEEASRVRAYQLALKQTIIDAHSVDNAEWVAASTIFALTKERRRMREAIRAWNKKERARLFNEGN
jgi:hypothetical protein